MFDLSFYICAFFLPYLLVWCIILDAVEHHFSLPPDILFPNGKANGSKEQSGWADCVAGMVQIGMATHPIPPSPTPPPNSPFELSQAHWNKALRLCCKPWFTRLCLCNAPMNMNIIICWHQDTRQIKTRLSGLLLLFQARDLNKNLKMRKLK